MDGTSEELQVIKICVYSFFLISAGFWSRKRTKGTNARIELIADLKSRIFGNQLESEQRVTIAHFIRLYNWLVCNMQYSSRSVVVPRVLFLSLRL